MDRCKDNFWKDIDKIVEFGLIWRVFEKQQNPKDAADQQDADFKVGIIMQKYECED